MYPALFILLLRLRLLLLHLLLHLLILLLLLPLRGFGAAAYRIGNMEIFHPMSYVRRSYSFKVSTHLKCLFVYSAYSLELSFY